MLRLYLQRGYLLNLDSLGCSWSPGTCWYQVVFINFKIFTISESLFRILSFATYSAADPLTMHIVVFVANILRHIRRLRARLELERPGSMHCSRIWLNTVDVWFENIG